MKFTQITLKHPENDNMTDADRIIRKTIADTYESCMQMLIYAAQATPDLRVEDFVHQVNQACSEMLIHSFPEIYK